MNALFPTAQEIADLQQMVIAGYQCGSFSLEVTVASVRKLLYNAALTSIPNNPVNSVSFEIPTQWSFRISEILSEQGFKIRSLAVGAMPGHLYFEVVWK